MRAEPVEAHTEEEPITSLSRFDLPGIIGDLDADDLHSKVGKDRPRLRQLLFHTGYEPRPIDLLKSLGSGASGVAKLLPRMTSTLFVGSPKGSLARALW